MYLRLSLIPEPHSDDNINEIENITNNKWWNFIDKINIKLK